MGMTPPFPLLFEMGFINFPHNLLQNLAFLNAKNQFKIYNYMKNSIISNQHCINIRYLNYEKADNYLIDIRDDAGDWEDARSRYPIFSVL